MKIKWRSLVAALAIPLAVGGLSAWVTKDAMERFAELDQPPLSPPGWVFPVVWTILFILMGVASYLVGTSGMPGRERRNALLLYGVQLVVNFFWSIFFFNMGWYLFSFFWLALLWLLVLETIDLFWKISRSAGILLFPYLAWITFAGYLNFGIFLLNP